jgi:glycosyltransferase involved in cell wall biosynthesis
VKVLLAVSRWPWPPRRGDQLRALQLARLLAGEHEVTLLAPRPAKSASHRPTEGAIEIEGTALTLLTYRRSAVRLLGLALARGRGWPIHSGLFVSSDLAYKLRRTTSAYDLVVLQLVRLVLHLDDVGGAPLVVDLIDSLSENLTRRAEHDRPSLRRLLRHEARRLAHAERSMIERAQRALLVAPRDEEAMKSWLEPHLAERLRVVPIHVEARHTTPRRIWPERPTLAITGNLGYFPNLDAVRWFLETVWPAVRREHPSIRLVVAGDRPPRSLFRTVEGVGAEVLASPQSLDRVLAESTVALAPLRAGSGLPIKILEAWAAGTPVVASPWAASGTTGVPNRDFLVAETPDAWLLALRRLLDDATLRQQIAAAGRAQLARSYSTSSVSAALREALAPFSLTGTQQNSNSSAQPSGSS